MGLIFVEARLWSDPPTKDVTIRCEHGRPVDGNPCVQCPCPVTRRFKHRMAAGVLIPAVQGFNIRIWHCRYCKAAYPPTCGYPWMQPC